MAMAQSALAYAPKCSITPRFDALYTRVAETLDSRGNLQDPELQRLANAPRRFAITRRLRALGAVELDIEVTTYLQALTSLETTQQLVRDREFRFALAKLQVFLSTPCPDKSAGASSLPSFEDISGYALGSGGGGGRAASSSDEQLNVFIFVSFVVSLFVALVGIAALAQAAQRVITARLNQRKTCRVAAMLRLGSRGGDPLFLGNVTILEQKGCRFHPDDERDVGAIADEAARRPISIISHGIEVPGRVLRIDERYVTLFFDLPLEKAWQKRLLAESTIIPQPTSEPPKMSNVVRVSRDEPRPAQEISGEQFKTYLELSLETGSRRKTDAA